MGLEASRGRGAGRRRLWHCRPVRRRPAGHGSGHADARRPDVAPYLRLGRLVHDDARVHASSPRCLCRLAPRLSRLAARPRCLGFLAPRLGRLADCRQRRGQPAPGRACGRSAAPLERAVTPRERLRLNPYPRHARRPSAHAEAADEPSRGRVEGRQRGVEGGVECGVEGRGGAAPGGEGGGGGVSGGESAAAGVDQPASKWPWRVELA